MSFIILDRDGVINYESQSYIKTPEEWCAIPGSLEAIAALNRSGFRVLIATNQSGIARNLYDIDTLDLIHEKLMRELAAVGGYIDEIFFCPHHPEDCCSCRKPKPGLLYQMQAKYSLQFEKTFFIGDSYVDMQTAKVTGCKPLLVLTGNGHQALHEHKDVLSGILNFPNLAKAVEYVLSQQ